MATKSDFAQKLLHDLRIRKERMAASSSSSSQNSSNGSSSIRGSNGGNIVSAYKGSPHNKTYEFFGLTSENSSTKSNNRTTSFQFEDASNYELVPYTKGKSNTKGGIPVLNFLQEIGKRTLGNGKIEIKSNFGKNSNSDSHIITFSQVHINEISKGIQKLNRILKNCSKGINLDSYSKNVGNELLKGAVDLEQSLRMLANLNEASEHMIKTRGKNRIKLLEDNEDYENDDGNKNVRSSDLKQIERPRFSFDKPNNNNKNSRHGSKKIIKNPPLALTYVEETQRFQEKPSIHSRSVSMDLDAENERISSRPQPKNPRTSNVIAKLMGLDDLPGKDESKVIKVDKQPEIRIIQIDQDHGNKILNQETGKEEYDKDETKHVSKIKHENPGNCNNLQQKVRKIDASEEKRNLQHLKQKPSIRDPKESQQERLDKSKAKTCLRISENKQASKKTIEKQLQGNRPKLTFNKRQGLDNATSETNETKNSKKGRKHRKKTDASTKQNEIVSKFEPNSIVIESMEQLDDDKNIRISGIAKQESNNNHYLQNPSQKPSLFADDIDIKPKKSSLHQIKGDHEIKANWIQIFENDQSKQSPLLSDNQLTKSEKQLKEILIKSKLFLHTAKTLFKFNIPVNVLHGFDDHNDDNFPNTKLILDCGIELLKKKGKRQELECYQSLKKKTLDCAIMFKSIDELIKQLNKDLWQLKSYGGKWGEECDPEEKIYQMLEKDVENKEPDKNDMWDFDWYEKSFAYFEKDEVIKDVEKHMLRKLLDELTMDLLDKEHAL